MLKVEETYWYCPNRACGLTALSSAADRELETRRCVCGSLMEKHTPPKVFAYLDFLREEASSEMREGAEKEPRVCER